jgi:hypothetical protein
MSASIRSISLERMRRKQEKLRQQRKADGFDPPRDEYDLNYRPDLEDKAPTWLGSARGKPKKDSQ